MSVPDFEPYCRCPGCGECEAARVSRTAPTAPDPRDARIAELQRALDEDRRVSVARLRRIAEFEAEVTRLKRENADLTRKGQWLAGVAGSLMLLVREVCGPGGLTPSWRERAREALGEVDRG